MTMFKLNSRGVLIQQKSLTGSIRFIQSFKVLRSSASLELNEEEKAKNVPQRKILKVAIVGRPNAGKSTIINKIFNLEVCGVSYKTHTTTTPLRLSFTEGDTQIVFVDTPGLVTHKECSRFNLTDSFVKWKTKVLKEADTVGIVNEIIDPDIAFKLHTNLVQGISSLPESLPVFLILNKIDLVFKKEALSNLMDFFSSPEEHKDISLSKSLPKIWKKFSKVFFTSAVNNVGLDELKDYLLAQAKPGKWVYEPDVIYDKPLNGLILDLIRARLLDNFPNEIPYTCRYEIEYLKENELGEVICISLITCANDRHYHLITTKRTVLRKLCTKLETDLYKILKRVFRIRLVVQRRKASTSS